MFSKNLGLLTLLPLLNVSPADLLKIVYSLIFWDSSNKEILTLHIPNNRVICTQPILIKGEVFASATDGDKYYLCQCHFTDNEVAFITELPDERSTYLEKHGSDLALIAQDKLVKYNTVTKESESITLSHPDALNLNMVDDVAWIAYTDPFDENSHSSIEARNYQTGEVLCSEEFNGAILQLEADDDRLFVRTYEELIAYSFANGQLTEQHRIRWRRRGIITADSFIWEQNDNIENSNQERKREAPISERMRAWESRGNLFLLAGQGQRPCRVLCQRS